MSKKEKIFKNKQERDEHILFQTRALVYLMDKIDDSQNGASTKVVGDRPEEPPSP